jgi:hypothetical protein
MGLCACGGRGSRGVEAMVNPTDVVARRRGNRATCGGWRPWRTAYPIDGALVEVDAGGPARGDGRHGKSPWAGACKGGGRRRRARGGGCRWRRWMPVAEVDTGGGALA